MMTMNAEKCLFFLRLLPDAVFSSAAGGSGGRGVVVPCCFLAVTGFDDERPAGWPAAACSWCSPAARRRARPRPRGAPPAGRRRRHGPSSTNRRWRTASSLGSIMPLARTTTPTKKMLAAVVVSCYPSRENPPPPTQHHDDGDVLQASTRLPHQLARFGGSSGHAARLKGVAALRPPLPDAAPRPPCVHGAIEPVVLYCAGRIRWGTA